MEEHKGKAVVLALGLVLGLFFKNIPLGLVFGLGVGALLDRQNRNK